MFTEAIYHRVHSRGGWDVKWNGWLQLWRSWSAAEYEPVKSLFTTQPFINVWSREWRCDVLLTSEKPIHYTVIYHYMKQGVDVWCLTDQWKGYSLHSHLSLYEAGSGGVMSYWPVKRLFTTQSFFTVWSREWWCDVLLTSEKAVHYTVIYHCMKQGVDVWCLTDQWKGCSLHSHLSLYEAGSIGVMSYWPVKRLYTTQSFITVWNREWRCDVLLTSKKAVHYTVIYHCMKQGVVVWCLTDQWKGCSLHSHLSLYEAGSGCVMSYWPVKRLFITQSFITVWSREWMCDVLLTIEKAV